MGASLYIKESLNENLDCPNDGNINVYNKHPKVVIVGKISKQPFRIFTLLWYQESYVANLYSPVQCL